MTEEHIVKLCRSYDEIVATNMRLAFDEGVLSGYPDVEIDELDTYWKISKASHIAETFIKSAQKTS